MLLIFILCSIVLTIDPNDEFLQPQLVVVLNGQTKHIYQGNVLIKSHSTKEVNLSYDSLSSTPEFNEDIEPYEYGIEYDENDIRISKVYQNVHRLRMDNEDLNQGNCSNYEVMEYLGDGTFSFVTRARRVSDGQIVVLKQIKPEYLYYVKKESKILKHLNTSSNIVQMIDEYYNNTDPVIVFADLKESKTFDYRTYYNDLSYTEVQFYFRKLFQAIAISHKKGIMHRDIKPANIIFSEQEVQLIDWGVSDFYYPLKQYRTRVGTRHYRAPEQLIHYKYYDYSVDVWAMGCILAGVVFRKQPFFDGRHNDDQLYRVVQVLGSRDFFDFCLKYNLDIPHDLQIKLQGYERMSLDSFVDDENKLLASGIVIDLLERIFVYDHNQRLTAEEVLYHEFFRL